MRDAIVAAIELNVFNRHSDRVVMANLAQAVNVLQSVILTEGGKMIKRLHITFSTFLKHTKTTRQFTAIRRTKICRKAKMLR